MVKTSNTVSMLCCRSRDESFCYRCSDASTLNADKSAEKTSK